MPVFQKLINFDKIFHQLTNTPLIVNDLMNDTEKRKEIIKNMITIRYSSDMLSVLPQCTCGVLKGEFVIGSICNKCNTEVKVEHGIGVEPLIWFRAPKGVAKIISPIILMMLKDRFYKLGFCTISYLIDTHYRHKDIESKAYKIVSSMKLPRGYNNFVNNFDAIIAVLNNEKIFNTVKRKNNEYLNRLINENKDCIFSNYLPLPNKSLFVIESTVVGTYLDISIVDAINAITTLIGIETIVPEYSLKMKESRTAKALFLLTAYYKKYFKKNLAKKTGIFRKHIFGTRTHFSYRGVISSITEPGKYNDIYLPWAMANALLRPHLLNKLMRLNYSLVDSINFLHAHSETYHPLLEQLHTELINESGHGGIYCILLRNPSLLVGSEQFLRISKIKTNPADFTIGLNILVIKSFNADDLM